jgi:hypothetical protein
MRFLRALPLFVIGICMTSGSLAYAGVVSSPSATLDGQMEPDMEHTVGISSEASQQEQKPGIIKRLWNSITEEANITASVGILQLAMTVKRKSDGATATMIQRDENAFFLSYGSKPSFFKDSSFGYTVMVNYVHFTMKQQEFGHNNYIDLNTEVKGQMVYAVPTLFYQWGDHRYDGTFIRLGAGIGLGAATYSGTVRFTSTGEPGSIERTANRSYAPRLATSWFLETQWKHLGMSISYASPRIYGDDYDVRVSDYSIRLGYTYYF